MSNEPIHYRPEILWHWRGSAPRRSRSTTKPGTLLKNAILVRTVSERYEKQLGFLDADLIAHCRDSAEGFYLTTLFSVNVAMGWCEPVAVWGKGQGHADSAIHRVRKRLSIPMLGLDSDNGSELINQGLHDYYRRWRILFAHSRSYKKKDSCHV